MRFPSRWRFDLGTTLALTLEVCGTVERARAEGLVVACEPIRESLWLVTVLFLQAPTDMRKLRNSEIRGDFTETLLR